MLMTFLDSAFALCLLLPHSSPSSKFVICEACYAARVYISNRIVGRAADDVEHAAAAKFVVE